MSGHGAVLITRSAEDAQAYGDSARDHGYAPLYEPMLHIEVLPTPLPDISTYDTLIFTSAHAPRLLAAQTARRAVRVFAVGDHTAQAARDAGFQTVISAGGNVRDLIRLLGESETGRALYLRAADIASPLPGADEHILYRALPAGGLSAPARQALGADPRVKIALFFSARGAATFTEIVRQNGLEGALSGIKALCMSPAVLESVSVLPWRERHVAATPERAAMLALLGTLLDE